MIKLLIWLVIFYFGFRLLKSWLLSQIKLQPGDSRSHAEIEDVMVKDPVCGIYVPKSESLTIRHQGQEVHFCSEKCKQEFTGS